MLQLTQSQYVALRDKIYATLMANEEMGMGEMGPAREEAERIIDEWTQEQGIKILD